MHYYVFMDFDPIFYEAGFAGQSKQYLVEDSEGVTVADIRIDKKAPKQYEIKDTQSKTVLDTVYTRKEAIEAINLTYPEANGFSVEEYMHVSSFDVCKVIIDGHIKRIIEDIQQCEELQAEQVSVIPVVSASSEDNYRKSLATLLEYKGNRKKLEKPVHFQALKDYVAEKYNPVIVSGMEADDYISSVCWINYGEAFSTGQPLCFIAATIDKDFTSFPGIKWYWRNAKPDPEDPKKKDTSKCLMKVGFREAMRNFYTQMITGDTSDNIPGCKGTKEEPGPGPSKAKKALKDCENVTEMFKAVAEFYCDKYYPDWRGEFNNVEAAWWSTVKYEDWEGTSRSVSIMDIMEENGRLLWLQHKDTSEEIYLWKQQDMVDLEAYFEQGKEQE